MFKNGRSAFTNLCIRNRHIIPGNVKEQQFKELYEYATKEPHSALVIDATHGKPIFKKNFDKILNIHEASMHHENQPN